MVVGLRCLWEMGGYDSTRQTAQLPQTSTILWTQRHQLRNSQVYYVGNQDAHDASGLKERLDPGKHGPANPDRILVLGSRSVPLCSTRVPDLRSVRRFWGAGSTTDSPEGRS